MLFNSSLTLRASMKISPWTSGSKFLKIEIKEEYDLCAVIDEKFK